MDVTRLSRIFTEDGPFASVLLDVSRDSETGAHEQELRVRAAAEELAQAGAPAEVVEAVSERLSEQVDLPAPAARTVVANRSGVVFDEVTHQRVDPPSVGWGPLPDLVGWLHLADRNLRFVLALVDHEGGDVAVYNSDIPEPESQTSAGGETTHVHKVPVGGWSALRYQHETENVWSRNADAVADEVQSVIRSGVRLVLVAGDPRSAAQVTERLENTPATVVRLESGGRAEDGGDEAQQQAIREALMAHVVSRRLELAHRLKDQLGQDSAVATGVREVAEAFVRGQVDTLLLDPAEAAEFEVVVREHPGLDLGAVPADKPLRADQALVAAAVRTSANVAVLPRAVLGGSPVAALLRWDDSSN
ncbi:baeRF2 domain-containing protein [Kribbella sp. CA-293567]|uniref:baeRF2 domain-containing protein n=1 Tax=Kribbella sp. CA-293567 TaxID=3002436 RepID=UPI0022DD4152|nr:Vms1/Ankzf1 family peptidyl-tRNA hydrolase [Kribbella sp. CA-293567]WBQ04044.1 Vms1/Ankzf1 family peptidyl-tRNA hydrolase [Kribbella sp. CA-293567]